MKKTMTTATRTTSKGAALRKWARVSFMLKCVMLATSAVMVTSASGKGPTCTSHVGVPDFAIAGKAPQRQRGLTFCQEHKASTCCDKDTTDSVRRVVYNMQSNQFSAKCRDVSSRPQSHPLIPPSLCSHDARRTLPVTTEPPPPFSPFPTTPVWIDDE